MITLLLALIYLAFISLGLPDSLLGSAWPVMHAQFGAPLSFAGAVTMVIAGCTICSSLLSDRLTSKLGAGLVTAVSTLMTAAALFGFSKSSAAWMLCVWAVPYGLGAGAIDAALNNYVALHYNSRHMNWLHCFWGVGAAISPYIMGYCLTGGYGWEFGYTSVSVLQAAIAIILFASLPLWKLHKAGAGAAAERTPPRKLSDIIRLKGVKVVLIAFFAYCAVETTTGLWASSYLVLHRGISPDVAARYASLYFLGITAGRFLSGFIATKIGDRNMIRIGVAGMTAGILMILLPVKSGWVGLYGLVVAGFGSAPVYPSIIHSTPVNFGAENSQAVIGLQMAGAYTGSTLMPPLFGLIANHISIGVYPYYLLLIAVLLVIMTERLNRTVGRAGLQVTG